MNRDFLLRILRGTKANLETAKSAGQLLVGEPYLLTDTGCLAIGTATNAYTECAASNVANTFTAPQTFNAGVNEKTYSTNGGSAYSVNLTNGSTHSITLNSATCAITLPTPVDGMQVLLKLKQDATGNRAVTWATEVTWRNNLQPSLPTTANAWEIVGLFVTDGTWHGFTSSASRLAEDALAPYIKASDVNSTFLTASTAASTYLTQADATSTYAKLGSAQSFTAAQTINSTLTANGLLTINQGVVEKTVTANTGSAYTIDLTQGSVFILTITAACTITLPAVTAGQQFTIVLKTGATLYTVTWAGTLLWGKATAPTLATANKRYIVSFLSDGATWCGATNNMEY